MPTNSWTLTLKQLIAIRALEDSPAYSQDLSDRIGVLSRGAYSLHPSTTYSLIQSMEESGLIEAIEYVPGGKGGPDRKYYQATQVGLDALDDVVEVLK